MRSDLGRGGGTVHHRHPQVHQNNVRSMIGRQCHRLLAVTGKADDLDPFEASHDRGEALTNNALIVGDENSQAGTSATTFQPRSVGPASTRPPNNRIRSSIPWSP